MTSVTGGDRSKCRLATRGSRPARGGRHHHHEGGDGQTDDEGSDSRSRVGPSRSNTFRRALRFYSDVPPSAAPPPVITRTAAMVPSALACTWVLLVTSAVRGASAFVAVPLHHGSSLASAVLRAAPRTITLDGQELETTADAVTPTGNAVWVKVRESLVATSGGVLLPDQSQQRPTEGVVVAAGPGKRHPHTGILIHNPVQVGQSVVYGLFDGKKVEYNGEDCQVLRDDNILLTYTGVTMRLETVTPVRDWVLVELEEEKLTTQSGVVVANQVLKGYAKCVGRVVKVGEGRLAANGAFTPSPVAVGDFVKFKDYAGNEIEIEGKQYSVVKMVDILCTLEEEEGPAT